MTLRGYGAMITGVLGAIFGFDCLWTLTQMDAFEAFFVAMMNSKYEGGGVMFCPKAKNFDGQLDLMIVSDVSKLKVLLLIPFALFGWHVHFRGAYERTCKLWRFMQQTHSQYIQTVNQSSYSTIYLQDYYQKNFV